MLHIGLLVDQQKVPVWVNDIIVQLCKNDQVVVKLIVLNDGGKPAKSPTDNFDTAVYRILRWVDRKLMPVGSNPFKKVSLVAGSIPVINVKPIQTKFSDKFPADVIDAIREHQIDIFLRFGFRILRGDILTVAKYGIISLHHGDTDTYRGGPPAFWEVVNEEPLTAVTIQQLTEDLDGGNILGKTYLRTDTTSFYRNQHKLYWAGKELMTHTLNEIINQTPEQYFSKRKAVYQKIFYSSPLFKNPGNKVSAGILFNWLYHTIQRKVHDIFFLSQWQLIYYYDRKSTVFQPSFFRYKKLVPPADRIWADPFIAIHENKYYLFFEEKLKKEANAHIAYVELGENGVIEPTPKIALKESFHLSYPFIFNHENKWYMIPEAAGSGQLYLYESTSFPGKWERIQVLIKDQKIYDATLHFHDGYWYLFCTSKLDNSLSSDVYLHIFYSKDFLREAFIPHPGNPHYRDIRRARPAGKIFLHEGELLRPSQVSAPGYGNKININRIITLSPEKFEEEVIDTIGPEWNKRINSIHTFNHAEHLSVADIQTNRFSLFRG